MKYLHNNVLKEVLCKTILKFVKEDVDSSPKSAFELYASMYGPEVHKSTFKNMQFTMSISDKNIIISVENLKKYDFGNINVKHTKYKEEEPILLAHYNRKDKAYVTRSYAHKDVLDRVITDVEMLISLGQIEVCASLPDPLPPLTWHSIGNPLYSNLCSELVQQT